MSETALLSATPHGRALDAQHHLHPFPDFGALAEEGSRIVTRAEGCTIWDSEGKRTLDGMAGLWCVNIGYGRDELAEAASRQMRELPYYNTFFKSATPPSVELAAKLAHVTPAGLNHVYFANSGSEANDTIVRMVRHYWNLKGKPDKKTFISRRHAYHGSTLASASLGGMSAMHEQADLPLPGFTHVEPPYWYRYGGEMDPEDYGVAAARKVEEKILELGADHVAAFIGEPIMGAGGVLVPPESYWPEIQRICREHDVLLIADEVICGFGRTGEWFGADSFGIEADLMPLAKGLTSGYLPLSAVMVGKRVSATLFAAGSDFNHGFTYSGHPVSCAVGLENIRILEEEGLIERAGDDVGPYFQARLRELEDHSLVGEVRGRGMVAAIELTGEKASRKPRPDEGAAGTKCREHSLALGLMMRATRDSMILSPPLVISRAEIDELVAIAAEAIERTARDIQA